MTTERYKISVGPPLVSQVCERCGAEVGSRSIHDKWHLLNAAGASRVDPAAAVASAAGPPAPADVTALPPEPTP